MGQINREEDIKKHPQTTLNSKIIDGQSAFDLSKDIAQQKR